MATATPARRSVHWSSNGNTDYSDAGSPSSQFSDDSIVSTTSSLQYVNSQLIAHGFAPGPIGISLDGLEKRDMDRAVKCFLDLLAQRMKDMTRTEQLTTDLRTLRYDHERMTSMYKTASESAANFEREVNLQKSRLSTVTKTLQATESAHKHTSAELARTRGALQAVRATHQMELKKKEKDIEKMVEKWNKLSDSQAKLGAVGSGLRFSGSAANASVSEAAGMVGRGKTLMEAALEEAERGREQLARDNLALRVLLLKAVNEIRNAIFEMRGDPHSPTEAELPPPMTLPELFPLSPPDFTTTTLFSALDQIREFANALSPSVSPVSASSSPVPVVAADSPIKSAPDNVERLNEIIEELKTKLREYGVVKVFPASIDFSVLDNSQQEVASQAAETQALVNRFADEQKTALRSDDTPADLITASAIDAECERLEIFRQELDEERKKFTEATIQLKKDRAVVEAEKIRLGEERRSWQAQTMLAERPPTPEESGPNGDEDTRRRSPSKSKSKAKFSSPRKPQSPKKFQISVGVGKAIRKTTRVGYARRRSSTSSSSNSSMSAAGVEPPFETEVIPPSILIGATPAPPPMSSSAIAGGSLLPTSFVLPPPSPCASLPPPKKDLLLSGPLVVMPPLFPSSSGPSSLLSTTPPFADSEMESDLPSLPPSPEPDSQTLLEDAVARRAFPYPVAKPLATHMIHAYSPVRPSPLSRILMLGNSPGSPSGGGGGGAGGAGALEALREEAEGDMMEAELFPPSLRSDEGLTLAQQLGVSESPPESHPPPVVFRKPGSPLREKKRRSGNVGTVPASKAKSTTTKMKSGVSAKSTGMLKTRSSSSAASTLTVEDLKKVGGGGGVKGAKSKSVGLVSGTKGKTASSSSATSVVSRPARSGPSGAGNVGRKEKENSTVTVVEGKDEDGFTTTTTSESNGILWKIVPPSADGLGPGAGRGGGGPRRVPLDSAEAPPVRYGRGRKV
ncbi:hypothetical protein GYMLUDRAFT_88727 [Collybiopsis luxurians FD-317 M1]|uniref:Afadin and alpha-actinin-binding-domain-containing protein n=1 Tax=Collybiopsis luxurians FD-317 M1 TaxID=944289 RepID=A0A0D0BCW9_9AGAR|nr:hypothetical protein GYMLUDRAFT_88727 [Collybiopsis luxurians FD-317 M1]